MADVNLGQLLATTLNEYRPKLVDNIFDSNAVFYLLRKNNAVTRRSADGGVTIRQPLMYGKNDTAGSYSGYDPLKLDPQEGIDAAEYNWKQAYASIVISGREEKINMGSNRIVDLLKAKVKQAEMSLIDVVSTAMFSDGTGNDGKDFTGFEAMIKSTGTYGGINSSTYTWWRAYEDTTSEALSLPKMRTAFNTVSLAGKDVPDLIVTTQSLYEKYENFFTQVAIGGTANLYTNFMTPSENTKKVADGGFQHLAYKGTPVVFDEKVPAGVMYFINTKHMEFVIHKDRDFEITPFKDMESQDARRAFIFVMGNFTCDRRKSFAALRNKS